MLVSTAAATGNDSPTLSASCFNVDEKIVLSKGDVWGPVHFSASDLGVDVSLLICAKAWTPGTWNFQGVLTIIVEDCCIMGDTMFIEDKAGFLCWPNMAYAEETSPNIVTVSHMILFQSVIKADIGYTDCPGGYPAGYDVTIMLT